MDLCSSSIKQGLPVHLPRVTTRVWQVINFRIWLFELWQSHSIACSTKVMASHVKKIERRCWVDHYNLFCLGGGWRGIFVCLACRCFWQTVRWEEMSVVYWMAERATARHQKMLISLHRVTKNLSGLHASKNILTAETMKVKVMFTLEQATRAQRWSRGSCTLSLTLALDEGGCSTKRPRCFTPGKDPVPIV